MSLPVRVTALLAAVVLIAAGAAFLVIHFFLGGPPVEDYTSAAADGQVNVVMQTAPQTTVSDQPDWVTYFIKNPHSGAWAHTTLFRVPAHTLVNVTVYGYDGCTPLRNPLWGQVTGTIGGVAYYDGRAASQLDSWSQCSVQHTFMIPGLGLNVPIASPTTLKANNNLCSASPCDPSSPHVVTTFSFLTPAQGGIFRWQCIIPCGLGYLDGNGGPMATLGYMSGEMEVSG